MQHRTSTPQWAIQPKAHSARATTQQQLLGHKLSSRHAVTQCRFLKHRKPESMYTRARHDNLQDSCKTAACPQYALQHNHLHKHAVTPAWRPLVGTHSAVLLPSKHTAQDRPQTAKNPGKPSRDIYKHTCMSTQRDLLLVAAAASGDTAAARPDEPAWRPQAGGASRCCALVLLSLHVDGCDLGSSCGIAGRHLGMLLAAGAGLVAWLCDGPWQVSLCSSSTEGRTPICQCDFKVGPGVLGPRKVGAERGKQEAGNRTQFMLVPVSCTAPARMR